MFPLVSAAVARVIPLERLRWLAFGHFEADECGSMNEWLAAAPSAELMHGVVGCSVSINDMADRPPRVLSNGEVIDIGGKRLRYIDTPHVPHAWDAGVMFEETTETLLCGDLFTRIGNGPVITDSDIVEPSVVTEDLLHYTSLGPHTGSTIRRLADLKPRVLATMHGASFSGDGARRRGDRMIATMKRREFISLSAARRHGRSRRAAGTVRHCSRSAAGSIGSSSRQGVARQDCDSDPADRGANEAGCRGDSGSALPADDQRGCGGEQGLNHY